MLTEAVDDEGDQFGDGGDTDSNAGQKLSFLLDEAVIVEDGANVDRHRQLPVQQVPRTQRYTVCNQPTTPRKSTVASNFTGSSNSRPACRGDVRTV